MKVLLICPEWPNLRKVLYENEVPHGMPGFYHFLEKSAERGWMIDIVVYSEKEFPIKHINSQICNSETIKVVDVIRTKNRSKLIRIFDEFMLLINMNRHINNLCKFIKYDFIYGQGNDSEAARLAACMNGIPFGMRKYGDDFAPLVRDRGVVLASVTSPLSALSYMTKKAFILATNDGTELDVLAKRFRRNPPYDMYLWNNGFQESRDNSESIEFDSPFIVHIGRILPVKGQINTIKIIYELRKRNVYCRLLFAGSIKDNDYYCKLVNDVRNYKVEDRVVFLGDVSPGQEKMLLLSSIASILYGENYNLNNVLIESLSYGAVVIAKDTPLIDSIISNGENGFIVSEPDQAVSIIENILNNTIETTSIRREAKKRAIKQFGSWDNRIERELAMLENHAISTS